MNRHVLPALLIGFVATVTSAQTGDSAARSVRIAQTLEDYVARDQVSGAIAVLADRDRIVSFSATGLADRGTGRRMEPDSLFAIASMTKPITATAIMILRDEGKLSIDDPVGKFIPELAHLKTADGSEHVVTLKHMLTHTSGMAELPKGAAANVRTLAELIPMYTELPLTFEPGSKWKYCQTGINTLGRIVEICSGQSYPEFLEQRLFGPLGMKDTTFYPTPQQIARLARSYKRVKDHLEAAPDPFITGHDPAARNYYPAPNGGLFSTAPDYCRFCQMLLRRGEWNGRRILSEESVALMTQNHTGELTPVGFSPGEAWGLGVAVVGHPEGITATLSPGTFGHGGAFGTSAWIDPATKTVYLLMIQRADFNNNDPANLRNAFQAAAKP
jgi:CubicO group peptidase (beta-lactamase class C family)